jgi:hypothetical protein
MTVFLFVTLLFSAIYEDSDSLIVNNDTLTICGSHQYAIKVHLENRGHLFVRNATGAPDSTGWLVLNAPLIVMTDSSSIYGSERGHKGGYMNSHPWGYGPGGGGAGGVSGGGGGGGAYGGAGGDGGDYSGGYGGMAYGDPSDTVIEMGSGGGGGRLSVLDGIGGNGGSAVSLRCCLVELDSSSITVNGQIGYDGSVEAGGGGAGGGILIWADTVHIHDCAMNANGANGGNTMGFGGGGGAGGGRIKILYTALLDTTGLSLSTQKGLGGIADMGTNGDSGTVGTIYIDQYTGLTEFSIAVPPMIKIQPNPVRQVAWISIEKAPAELFMYDACGRCVRKLLLSRKTESVNLAVLRSGVYFLRSQSSAELVKKIILIE